MNKKIKWAIPFAVLALTCGITAAGCNGCNKHEHSYTEWGYNETQHWKECPEDHEKDESTVKDHEFVDGSCECGATQQTPPVTDVTITNETTDTNGTVTLSKTTVKAGESVTVTVAPNEGYQLKSLTVNGANVFGAMTGNTYEFTVSADTTVIAVFEKIASSSVNAVISGKKYGVTGNSLTAGTDVTLSATGREDVATEIKAEGDKLVIKVDEIAGDNWSVKVDGYVAATIIIPRDAEYTTAIALEYDLMENLSTSWGNYDTEDLSNQNDGTVSHKSGYYQWVSSKDSYESVAITAKVVKGGYRQGVFIRFKGDNYDGDGYVMLQKENQQKICICGAGDGFKGNNLWKDNWDEYLKPLAKDEYELTLVRDGAKIYIFVDGEYKATRTLPEGYADKECYVGLFCTDATAMENSERTFEIAQASDFIEVSVTDETATDAHGTVTIDKHTATLNEQVTVTLDPENGYKIKDLKIDGVSVLSQMSGTSYTFTALKDTAVVAEFEESKSVNSLELTVNAANGFTAEGTKITLDQLGEKRTAVVGANGKATFGSTEKPVATGTHNVYADFGGYQIKLGTVNVEASDSNAGTAKPVSVTLGFTGSGVDYAESVSSANPSTGEFTYKLGKEDNGAYNNKYDIKTIENGGYFAQKISFAAMASEIGTGKKVSMSVILRTTTGKEIKFVVQNSNQHFGLDGKFCMGLDDNELGGGNGIFVGADASKFVNLDRYKDALLGDGLWIVLGYDAQTGGLVTYAGTSLDEMRPLKTWGTLPKGLKFNGFGTGKWFDNGSNADLVKVTLKYGETMTDIGMAIEEKVTVTASVNDEAMGTVALDATDGKYFSDTQANVTVTANKGYVLKSIKVGNGEAVTEGWTTDGNVYTYSFTVSENTTVVATFDALEVWESATLTLNGVTENTEVKLYDGVDTITAIAGANGVVTFTGENQIGKKVYTVTVKNVVFNVDFTTESAIRKTIGTVTVGGFSAKDNYNDGAKVIDMGAAKNSTEYAVTFNLKTNSKAAGWQQRWSLLLINDDENDNNKTTGIGCIGKNNNVLTVWGAAGASPDDDGRNPVFKGEAKYLKFDELVHDATGVNMKVVRQGSKATMYFELEGEWIEMLTVTLGSGETNLKFACSYGVEWQISDMAINYISEFDYLVNASFEGDAAHGYKVSVAQTANAATVVIQTNDANAAWSYFPNAIKVNGTPIDFSTVTKESLGANRCKYTFTLNITENTDIVVTVGKGTKVGYSASVNDGTMGNVVCNMEDKNKEYYWNDKCTFTVTAKEGYELESIVIGEGSDAITVTADGTNKWTQNGKVYTYSYLVTGDIKVVANFKETTLADVTLTVAAKDWDGTEITLEAGTQINFASVTSGQTYTYAVGGDEVRMQVGTYTVTCAGFCTTKATVGQDGAVTVNLAKPIATSTSNEITVTEDKTIAIKGNGASDRNNHRAISADLKLTDEQKNSTGLTLTFNVKNTLQRRNGDDWAASRFGVQIGEGELGFFVFVRNSTAADVVKLNPGSLDINPNSESKWHGDDSSIKWINEAVYSEAGLNVKVVRVNGVIHIYAQNGEKWVQLDDKGTVGEAATATDLTIGNAVKNQIKFLAGGDDWQFSDIAVTLPEASKKATLTASVNNNEYGRIETDVQNYYKGDKAILTVTANQGYELEKLVIGGEEVTEGWTKNGLVYTYELTLADDTTVVANLKEIPVPKVTPDITVSGAKYGSTETPEIAANTQITLTNSNAGYTFTGSVGADGKVTFTEQVYVSTYTVSAEGYFDSTVEITEDTTNAIVLTLYVITVDCEITVGETGDEAKFVAEGAQLTFTKDSVTKTATVTDGKVKLTGVLTGNWKTTANFGGYELDLGWTTVDKSGAANITVDASGIMWSKKEKDIVSSNIAEGTVEIITNQAYHNKITLATAVEGGAMAFKFALPDSVKAKLQGNGDVNATVTMPVGNNGGSLWVIIHIEKSGENKKIQFAYYDKVDGGNWFDESKRLDLSAQWDTLVAGGLWVVVDLNKDTGALTTYVGATLETATAQDYARTCTLTNKSIDKIEIGNALDAATDNLLVTFRYGATVQDLGIGSTPAGNE